MSHAAIGMVLDAKNKEQSCDYEFKDSYIHLNKIESKAKGTGYGTRSMRFLFQRCLIQKRRLAMTGKADSHPDRYIELDAAGSHLFHLYMGMIPKDKEINYIKLKYGLKKTDFDYVVDEVDHLALLGEGELVNLHSIPANSIAFFKRIISGEKNIPEAKITESDIINHQAFLKEIKSRTCSYVKDCFIPTLIEVLEKNRGNKYPDTSVFCAMHQALFTVPATPMFLSKEGVVRWRKAVSENMTFESFKRFEQLRALMSAPQIEKLDAILAKPVVMGEKKDDIDKNIRSDERHPRGEAEPATPSFKSH